MAKILVDAERSKYPHSGVGFFASCLVAGLHESQLQAPLKEQLIYYTPRSYTPEGHIRRHYGWHRLLNPTTWDCALIHITHQLQTYFPQICPHMRCILTLHDLNFLYEELSPTQYERRLSIVRLNLQRADVIVCISHFVKACLEEHRSLFKLKSDVRIEVIHNGIRLEDEGESQPAALQLPEGSEYILSIGVLQHKKQQHSLVDMLAHLPEHLHLVLVYSDTSDYESNIRYSIAQHSLERRVHFLRNVSSAEKCYLLRHCLAYMHPSTAEGFGIPPIEAMYAGRPVFLSRSTSLPEIGGQEAYYFRSAHPLVMAEDFRQGLQDYAEDVAKAERLRAWAKGYDYRRMGADYRHLYEETLSILPHKS